MKTYVTVREARPEDKEAVLSFCRKTWEWGDYIPEVWDEWIKDPNGKIFVGVIDGKPVGMANVIIPKEGEAWLRGARTHPEYRRRGVNKAITTRCLEYAAERKAKVARLATDSNNIPAQRALAKLGFNPIARFIEWEIEDFKAEKSIFSKLTAEEDVEKLWSYLERSICYKLCSGLYTKLYTWITLDRETLENFIVEGKSFKAVVKNNISGLVLFDEEVSREWRENSLQVCYIDGNFEGAVDVLKFLKEKCVEKGIKKIYAFSCNYPPLTRAFESLGFKREENEIVIYEKRLNQKAQFPS